MSQSVESWWCGLEWCILNAKKYGVVISLKKWSVGVTDEFFRPKPWYFERDCPVCTWSASSFCRNPLYSFAHAMWVKWWYHDRFQPFQSSFCSAFQFHGHLALKKSVNAWKIANDARKGWKLMTWPWMVHIKRKKVWSCYKFKKMKCRCNRWVFSSETLILRKRLSSLYTKCIQYSP